LVLPRGLAARVREDVLEHGDLLEAPRGLHLHCDRPSTLAPHGALADLAQRADENLGARAVLPSAAAGDGDVLTDVAGEVGERAEDLHVRVDQAAPFGVGECARAAAEQLDGAADAPRARRWRRARV